MTEKEKQEYIKEIKEYTKEITSTPEKAKEFLLKTGVYTANGNLKRVYK